MKNIIQLQVDETTNGIFAALDIPAEESQRVKLAAVVEGAVIKAIFAALDGRIGDRIRASRGNVCGETNRTANNSALIAILSSLR